MLRKCLLKFKCSTCETQLKSTNNLSNLRRKRSITNKTSFDLIRQKIYNNNGSLETLCWPNDTTYVVVKLSLELFAIYYKKVKYRPKLLGTLYNIAIKNVKDRFPEFFSCPESCLKHRHFLIRYTVLVRLQKQTLWESAFFSKTFLLH